MKAESKNNMVLITFNEEEALVLFEWLHQLNKEKRYNLFHDQAEERILFDIEAELEMLLPIIFDTNYQEQLAIARNSIRDDLAS